MIALVRGVIAAIACATIDVERHRIDVDQHRTGAEARHTPGRGEERIGRRDHFRRRP